MSQGAPSDDGDDGDAANPPKATRKASRLHRGGAPERAVPITTTSRKTPGPALRRAVVETKPPKPPTT